jgi:hypothetical protein
LNKKRDIGLCLYHKEAKFKFKFVSEVLGTVSASHGVMWSTNKLDRERHDEHDRSSLVSPGRPSWHGRPLTIPMLVNKNKQTLWVCQRVFSPINAFSRSFLCI